MVISAVIALGKTVEDATDGEEDSKIKNLKGAIREQLAKRFPDEDTYRTALCIDPRRKGMMMTKHGRNSVKNTLHDD